MTDYKLVPVLGDELLPCPFCGGDDIGNRYIETYSCDSSYDIFGCKACGAGFDNDDQSGPSLWNRRAAAPAVQGEPTRRKTPMSYPNGLDMESMPGMVEPMSGHRQTEQKPAPDVAGGKP